MSVDQYPPISVLSRMTADHQPAVPLPVVVVIGAGGIGRAVAQQLGSGHLVLLADVSKKTLHEAGTALLNAGHLVETMEIDATNEVQIKNLAAHAFERGPVDKVVYTSGGIPPGTSVELIYRVNLMGAAYAIDAFEKVIAAGGSFIAIASLAGHIQTFSSGIDEAFANAPTSQLLENPAIDLKNDENFTAYSTSKHALIVRANAAVSRYAARGVRINTVSPGAVWTPSFEAEMKSAHSELIRAVFDIIPVARVGTADDVAHLVAFLTGPNATYLTGADYIVDGGTRTQWLAMMKAQVQSK